jgi:hypothetical protein
MGQKLISQRTIVELMRALREYGLTSTDLEEPVNYTEFLYERDFPDWFVKHAAESYEYGWNWQKILLDMRNGRFFFYHNTYSARVSITDGYLSEDDAKMLGENLIQRLAALGANLPTGEPVLRSLQLDGFDVNNEKLSLVPLEGPVSAREEEDRLTGLVKTSGVPEVPVVLKHIADANSLYTSGKYHPSLNESRNLIQALIDGISIETEKHGNHSRGLPGGTANRIDYLALVGFLTADEKAALNSGWGSLSAGSHPGVPEPEQARIGLILALEFGQLLVHKFVNWKVNGYRGFS